MDFTLLALELTHQVLSSYEIPVIILLTPQGVNNTFIAFFEAARLKASATSGREKRALMREERSTLLEATISILFLYW